MEIRIIFPPGGHSPHVLILFFDFISLFVCLFVYYTHYTTPRSTGPRRKLGRASAPSYSTQYPRQDCVGV